MKRRDHDQNFELRKRQIRSKRAMKKMKRERMIKRTKQQLEKDKRRSQHSMQEIKKKKDDHIEQ
jgi:hypothetical protein